VGGCQSRTTCLSFLARSPDTSRSGLEILGLFDRGDDVVRDLARDMDLPLAAFQPLLVFQVLR
jgi:hypothetical protein